MFDNNTNTFANTVSVPEKTWLEQNILTFLAYEAAQQADWDQLKLLLHDSYFFDESTRKYSEYLKALPCPRAKPS